MIFSGYLKIYNFQTVLLAAGNAGFCRSFVQNIVALCMLLRKIFSYPYKRKDTELGWIFTLDFIYQRQHHVVESWNLFSLQPPYLQRYVDAVTRKGARSYNWLGFGDGTIAYFCRHVLNEKVVYSRHTRVHGVISGRGFAKWLDYTTWRTMGRQKTWLYIIFYESDQLNQLQWLVWSNDQSLFLY